jgi:nucleoside-diphosphate-sugar epimerase
MPTRVLVTGGGGFIGRHLANALADRGDRVTALDLCGEPWRPEVAMVHVDLRDPVATAHAIAGHDLVFHAASLVHTKASRAQDVWAVNLGGTEHVLNACRAAKVAKLVYVSSASVVYEGQDIRAGDESLPYAVSSQATYADSKIAAERLVLASSNSQLATCAVRPHVVFGPGDTRLLPAILQRARSGTLRFRVGSGAHRSDFTWIGNLTDALLAAGDRLGPDSPLAGQAYFVTNGEPMGFFDFVDRVLVQLDLPTPKRRIPYAVAYGVAAAAEAWDTLRGGTLNAEDGMSRFAIRYLCTDHWFRIDKARRDLGYEPAVSIDQGIALTVAGLHAQA